MKPQHSAALSPAEDRAPPVAMPDNLVPDLNIVSGAPTPGARSAPSPTGP